MVTVLGLCVKWPKVWLWDKYYYLLLEELPMTWTLEAHLEESECLFISVVYLKDGHYEDIMS